MIKYIIYRAKFLKKDYIGYCTPFKFEYGDIYGSKKDSINFFLNSKIDGHTYVDIAKKDFFLKVSDFIDDCEKFNYVLYRMRFHTMEKSIEELKGIVRDEDYKNNENYKKKKEELKSRTGVDVDETLEELKEELESLERILEIEKSDYCEKSEIEILKENVTIEILFNKTVKNDYDIKSEVKKYIKRYNTVIYGYNSIEDIDGEVDDLFNYKEGDYIVYKHTSPNGKSYIGITKNKTNIRWGKNGNNYKPQTKFWNSIKKYGWDNFTHEILEEGLSLLTASEKERYYIKKYDSIKNGYNVDEGGVKL